jgi:hypothetical protein
MGTNSLNRNIVIVPIVTNYYLSNLHVTKKRKQPDFWQMSNDVTITIFEGSWNGRYQYNRYNFLFGQ